MVWDDESIKQLIKLWDKGLSTTEIAKKMNVSKNSVVGKVHRLCLKARPSPIKKKSADADNAKAEDTLFSQIQETVNDKPESKKTNADTEKKQSSGEKEKKTPKKAVKAEVKVKETEQANVQEKVETPNKNKTDNKPTSNIKLIELDSHTCRWPIGDPRDEDFCFCGKKVRAGQTYCDEHSQVAYVKATAKR